MARRKTRAIWPKLDCLQPNLQPVKVRTHRNDARNRCPTMSRLEPGAGATSVVRGRRPARTVKEMSGRPTSRSIRTTKTNAGSPVGREPYGDGVPIVVVGVTSHQGGRESRQQGEGAQVVRMSGAGRHA